jgi:hypothetical protein
MYLIQNVSILTNSMTHGDGQTYVPCKNFVLIYNNVSDLAMTLFNMMQKVLVNN